MINSNTTHNCLRTNSRKQQRHHAVLPLPPNRTQHQDVHPPEDSRVHESTTSRLQSDGNFCR